MTFDVTTARPTPRARLLRAAILGAAGALALPVLQGYAEQHPTATAADPRVGLKAGLRDAGEAIWNMRKISSTPSPQGFQSA